MSKCGDICVKVAGIGEKEIVRLRNSFPSHNGAKHNWRFIVELC